MFILPGLQLGLCKEGSRMNKVYGLDLLVASFLPTGNNTVIINKIPLISLQKQQ